MLCLGCTKGTWMAFCSWLQTTEVERQFFFQKLNKKQIQVSLAECEMTGCGSDIVTQMPKYNQAENRPALENINSMFWKSKGKTTGKRIFFIMA